MKIWFKAVFIGVIFLILCSCDRKLTENFFVKNDLSHSIIVKFETMNGDSDDILIDPKTEVLIFQSIGYGNSVSEFELDRLFKYFEVKTENNVSANINYLLNSNWKYNEVSETNSEYILIVDKECFN